MSMIIIGDPNLFAIESGITTVLKSQSQLAIGHFVIHIGGHSFGVAEPDATLLGCSYAAVKRRLGRRGFHCIAFEGELDATQIVDAVHASIYDEVRQQESFFGLSSEVFRNALTANEIIWAPDGDAAFDDGGHVLQFDQGNRVRLIGFKNLETSEETLQTVIEEWLDQDQFYQLLKRWQEAFDVELNRK
jgi:hypothetical protein